MRPRTTRGGAIGGGEGWPVLLLVLAVLLIPTACIGWFMLAAVKSERLAVRQRLVEVYSEQAVDVRKRLEQALDLRSQQLVSALAEDRLARVVADHIADGIVAVDGQGTLFWPVAAHAVERDPLSEMTAAWQFESRGQWKEAAEAWGRAVKAADDIHLQARCLQGSARTLDRLGKRSEAIGILSRDLQSPALADARDDRGRLVAPDAAMRAIELLPAGTPERSSLIDRLAQRLDVDPRYTMPGAQRVFLLERLAEVTGTPNPALAGERRSLDAAEQGVLPAADLLPLQHLARPPCWGVTAGDGWRRILGLYDEATFTHLLAEVQQQAHLPPGVRVVLVESSDPAAPAPFLDIPAGPRFPRGWRFELHLPPGIDPSGPSRELFYYWTGGLSIAAIVVLTLFLGLYLQRQQRLTTLKNDLIATVSHELKTPLASMRLLVETLQDHRVTSDAQRADYLALIARENTRLTRLIDNFLSFSRMERNKRQFAREPLALHDILTAAVEAMGDRAACVTVEPGPNPTLRGDRDALITALLNLLDNAWKYSPDPRRITLRTAVDNHTVSIAVSDHGIGIPRRHLRRIFDRFYQVDRSLTRTAGGTGLGLAIVKFIVEGHHGTIDVASTPNQGSIFTLRLPLEGPP